ncbi:MAG: PAS domain-containing protein [Phycisphaeraceae bacterium]|nr:PAS domain-containing protein [Phycisphaerales bacterium]MCB9861249.1 PAS domain-containing protein [Phycisphaeraceae bacterium]
MTTGQNREFPPVTEGDTTHPSSSNSKTPPTSVGVSPVWNMFVADPAVGVVITNLDAVIVYANKKSAQLFVGVDDPGVVIGKSMYDVASKEWVEERLKVYRRIAETGQPAIMRHIRRGRQLQSTVHAIPTPPGEAMQFLSITHEGEHTIEGEDEDFFVFESGVMDLGPLDVLSTRELEVLALIGQGLTTQEIAEVLFRSPKTIEGHRDSIAKKLGESSRIRLGQIARSAGLELADASLKRLKDEPSIEDTEL